MGNVIGLILWDSQPVRNLNVNLCVEWRQFSGCVGKNYLTQTDANGYFVFHNVVPGQYRVITRTTKFYNQNVYLFFVDTKGSFMQAVSSGDTLILDPWNIWKLDLNYTYPKKGETVPDGLPTFKWDPYPDAAYYQISIAEDKQKDQFHLNWVIQSQRVDGTEFTPKASLKTCQYDWDVQAFNAQGALIAESTPTVLGFLLLPEFSVANGQGSC